MIRSLIQIDNGEVQDFYDAFGFIYIDADERVAPDEKEDAVSSYIESPGEHRDGRRVDAPFDYAASFIIEAPNRDLENVNAKIIAFNNAVRQSSSGSDVKRIKEIAFLNLLNRVKIVGFPQLVAVPKKVYHSDSLGYLDYAQVELKIRVSDPSKCDFNLNSDNPQSLLEPDSPAK